MVLHKEQSHQFLKMLTDIYGFLHTVTDCLDIMDSILKIINKKEMLKKIL